METEQFDRLAHRFAARSNRRGLLGAFAGGTVLAKAGLPALSQPVGAEGACTLDLVATVRLGPNAGQFLWAGGTQPGQIHGRLTFGMSSDGTLAGAAFQLDDGSSLPVVGQATGYSLQARITFGDARALILSGVGEQTIATCRGAVGGLLNGPQPGDLGDWQAAANGPGSGAAVSPPAPQAPATVPTPPQEPAGSGCPEGSVWCGQTCANLSSDPANCGYCGTLCGQAESCIDGICIQNDFCQPGMTNCGDACFDLTSDFGNCGACFMECAQGQVCNAGTCVQIGAQCIENGQPCGGDNQCCSGYCANDGAVCATPVCWDSGHPCLVNWICCSGICDTFDGSYTCR